MGPGIYRLVHGDPEEVFVMTVREVPRRRLGPDAPLVIGELEGVTARVTGLVIDTHVHVDLDVAQSSRRDELLEQYRAEFEAWVPAAKTGAAPPPQPGNRLARVEIELGDDAGTEYVQVMGQSGGTGTEWLAQKSYLPVPPDHARQLTLRAQVPGQPEVTTRFALGE
jgi:hypothetical protein